MPDLCDICGRENERLPTGGWVCAECSGIADLRRERELTYRQMVEANGYWEQRCEKLEDEREAADRALSMERAAHRVTAGRLAEARSLVGRLLFRYAVGPEADDWYKMADWAAEEREKVARQWRDKARL